VKNTTTNEPFFVGHFPQEPVMPGVLQVEAMAQVGWPLRVVEAGRAGALLHLLPEIDNVKFRHKVVPR